MKIVALAAGDVPVLMFTKPAKSWPVMLLVVPAPVPAPVDVAMVGVEPFPIKSVKVVLAKVTEAVVLIFCGVDKVIVPWPLVTVI